MTQRERQIFLIRALLEERSEYGEIKLPHSDEAQKKLLRSLMNVRSPQPADDDFLRVQDEYLQAEISQRGITSVTDLTPIQEHIYLWQGDITTLKADGIVNAANSGMTGCYCPCHGCIDNAIHTFAGVRLRLECARLMNRQGHEEEIGGAKITPSFNLPCDYVLHTVGPIVKGALTEKDRLQLASCYRSCLALAAQNRLKSIAFCCISTGEFHFPNEEAAKIAVETVKEFLREAKSSLKVIFNVFKDEDFVIYKNLLS
ncbi:MAG: protein-ADP-ribose hydrolase [Butyrivibrio sp.]|nr:protein-ADP-ribose hydrolase [Butyrivibrio sp.]